MVVRSLPCIISCDDPIATNSHDRGAGIAAVDNHHLMVSDDVSKRRSSARIQKLKSKKALLLRCREESLNHLEEEKVHRKKCRTYQKRNLDMSNAASQSQVVESNGSDVKEEKVHRKKYRTYQKRKLDMSNAASQSQVVESNGSDVNTQVLGSNGTTIDGANVDGGAMMDMVMTEVAEGGTVVEKSASARATDTLRAFNKHYLHFIQEEEKRCGRVEADRKTAKGSKSKKRVAPEDDAKRGSKRPDLKAITKMRETNAILYPNKRFGSIPGIEVGHQFFSRAEMVAVGLHGHWLKGIDYIGQFSGKKVNIKKEFSNYTLPLAVAIVLSGQYEDDLDNCEDIVYTGQGGNNLLGDKRQMRDQVMVQGNLGLKNCIEQGVPVRVVRGHKSATSYVGKVYTYDGLYKVSNFWAEKGVSGFTVFKFRLQRLEGQPLLTTDQVQFTRGRIPNSVSEIRGLVCEDITGGQEDIPIPATNLVDDPPIAPTGFTYCKFIQVAESVKLPQNAAGCGCKDTCRDPRSCSCARLNGSDFPYVHVHRDGGRLIEPKAVVFECGPNCGCGPSCVNRTSQRGLKYRLEVFRTPKKGWAVRSWDYIPAGAPVCEYIGVLMKTDEIDTAFENNYIFDIDCLQTMKGLDGRERRFRDVSLPTSYLDDHKSDIVPEFCIDAGSRGNIARFINHSCQPNLFVQCVLSSHHDVKLARVVLFAADNIPPLKELTYDYGYVLDSVTGPDGKIRKLACYCGASDCRKRLF
ncbi:histone-lysine N-methyltransferase, H3 lysine-9 specific SUVH4-like [Cornus florida]|uniref:histone-lysine N-methyltransferase, H3 lysine-9 specific SUVH4-like n=1 Tax=Cornus florida TaxID=4283 RepID=UPI0028971EB0|nr:histone-lysine N-methyltransferase, H3 lysine-9 specific SUVH4-like [Cornus florida]